MGIDRRFLHALVDNPERTLDDLVRFSLEDHDDDPVGLEEDLVAIFRHLKTPKAIPFYLSLIRRYSGEMPDDLMAGFHQLKEESVGPLVDLYQELGEEDGAEIPFVLASLGIRNDAVLAVLKDHLEYDATDGALCLGLYGDPSAKATLEALLNELDVADSTQAALRRDLLEAIEQLGDPAAPEPQPAFDLYEDYLDEAGPAFYAMPEAERLSFLNSANVRYRSGAAESFLNEDLSAQARERLLHLAKEDPEPDVRARAWEALAGEVEDRPEVRRAMLDRVRAADTPKVERAGAIVGLSSEAGGKEVRPYVLALYEDPETRAKALQAMWRSFDRTFAEYFPKNLDSSDVETVRHAIWGCGYLNVTSVLSRLRGFFENDELRADALFAYALSAPSDVTPARMRSLLEKIDKEAGGLMPAETDLVETALDQRLMMHGREPVFHVDDEEEAAEEGDLVPHVHGPGCNHKHEAPKTVSIDSAAGKPGRNDPCPCGSGKKYKKCCGASQQPS